MNSVWAEFFLRVSARGQKGEVGAEQGVEHPDCLVEQTVFQPYGFGPETLQSPP